MVKRYEGWWMPNPHGEGVVQVLSPVVLASDYDALAAELATLLHQAAIFNGRHEADQTRIAALESALQTIGNELDLHGAEGPAGDAFRSCLNPTWDKLKMDCDCRPLHTRGEPHDFEVYCPKCGKVFREAETLVCTCISQYDPNCPVHPLVPMYVAETKADPLPKGQQPLSAEDRAVVEQYLADVMCPECHCPKHVHRPGCSQSKTGDVK